MKLNDENDNFLTIIKDIPDIYFLVSGDTTILDYHGRNEDLYKSPKEFLGKKMKDILPEEIGKKSFDSVKNAIETQKIQILEYSLPIKEEILYFKAKHIYISEDQIAILIRNMTDQKHSEEKFLKVFKLNPSPMAISTIDNGSYIDVNESFLDIIGYQKEEIIGKSSTKLNIWENIKDREKAIKAIKKKGRIQNLDLKIRTKNGKIINGLFSAEIIQIQKKSYILSIMNDITELVKIEEKLKESERNLRLLNQELEQRIEERTKELKESEKKYRTLFENMTEGFAYHEVIVDKDNKPIDYRFIEANPAFSKLTGININNLIGRKVTEVLPGSENDPTNFIKRFGNVGLTGGTLTIEEYSEALDRWYRVSGFSPEQGYFAVVFTDITKIINAHNEVKKSEDKYRKAYNNANFYKDLITHDMSNILQSIISSYELISINQNQLNLKEKCFKYLDIIKESTFRGKKLISNVQKISEIENTTPILKKIDVYNLLNKIISFIKKIFQNRDINIQIIPIYENIYVKADDFLSDVFENILINAIRYNNNLQVKIIIQISIRKENGTDNVILEFIDNGIGIEDSRKKFLFKKGFKNKKGSKGMGLGLSLVKKIIKGYEGKIWLEDKIKGDYSKGSKFIIMIPKIDQ
ncbi:MAG: PAS domain S-box protein [Candidatus Lokiarchaeota archaeon]|nr:PAS domain S-box protein [Candidatus Lokiarchaeota archaeon]